MKATEVEKMEALMESCKPCYNCNGPMAVYQRMQSTGMEEPVEIYSYLQCDECGTVSKNTAYLDTNKPFTIEDVVNDWNDIKQHKGNMH